MRNRPIQFNQPKRRFIWITAILVVPELIVGGIWLLSSPKPLEAATKLSPISASPLTFPKSDGASKPLPEPKPAIFPAKRQYTNVLDESRASQFDRLAKSADPAENMAAYVLALECRKAKLAASMDASLAERPQDCGDLQPGQYENAEV